MARKRRYTSDLYRLRGSYRIAKTRKKGSMRVLGKRPASPNYRPHGVQRKGPISFAGEADRAFLP